MNDMYKADGMVETKEVTVMPFGHNVLLKRIPTMHIKSAGGIIQNHSATDVYDLLAEILEVGPEVEYLKKGMIIRTDSRRTFQFTLIEERFLIEDRMIMGQVLPVDEVESAKKLLLDLKKSKEEVNKKA